MATRTVTSIKDIPNLERKISGLSTEANTYQDKLASSPTALGGSGDPTSYDISNQEAFQRLQGEIQGLENKRQSARWYGDESKDFSAEAPESSQGAVGRAIDFINRPLYGVVGATKHFIGQGTDSLWGDVADNAKRNKNSFGDVLRTSGLPGGLAAPIGFALDIALDPVNWATAGTSALLPRLATGAYKGFKAGETLKGLSVAAKSGVLEKVATVGRFVPGLRKSEAFGKLGAATLKATEGWETLRGVTTAELVARKGAFGSKSLIIEDGLNKLADSIPGGRPILDSLWYDPKNWIRQAYFKDVFEKAKGAGAEIERLKDQVAKAAAIGKPTESFEKEILERTAAMNKGQSLSPFNFSIDVEAGAKLADNAEDVQKKMAGLAGTDPELVGKIEDASTQITKDFDDAAGAMKDPKVYITKEVEENALRVANDVVGGPAITWADLEKMRKANLMDVTGMQWFDKAKTAARKWEKDVVLGGRKIAIRGSAILDKYEQGMGIFRAFKVGANVASHTFAVVGNMVMQQMATGDVSFNFLKTLKLAFEVYHNKPGAALKLMDLLKKGGQSEDAIKLFMESYKTAAHASFGSLDFMRAEKNAQAILEAASKAGIKIVDGPGAMKELEQAMAKLKEEFPDQYKVLKKATDKSTKVESGTSAAFKELEKGTDNLDRDVVGTGMLSNEIFTSGAAAKPFLFVKEKAKDGNVGWKLLDLWMNKMPSQYEKYDQIFKLSTFTHATTHGYTETELRGLRHLIDITPEELALGKHTETAVLKSGKVANTGKTLYKLSPKAALELANVMYLNYNAMPSAIKVMRQMPLMGSPFVSFMYGMALKTGQTMVYNPSAFNKVTFAMQEFGGPKTPLEKQALGTNAYAYLNQPGMMRIPFFTENPSYLNMASSIPYYSLNMFGPTQTDYGDSLRGTIATWAQKAPLMKDPVGSSLFDNFILPLILGDVAAPKGQFGQPLYPTDATFVDKALYGTRSFAEAFVPGSAAYAGLLTPEAAAEALPLYRWRSITNAVAGKNAVGIKTKESKWSRTTRELLKASGVPLQAPVKTEYTQG